MTDLFDRVDFLSWVFDSLGRDIRKVNQDNGWEVLIPEDWDLSTYRIPASLALLHSELSEALESFREGDKENFTEELADVQIRLLDMVEGLDIDLAAAVEAKIAKNRLRAYRHGGKRI